MDQNLYFQRGIQIITKINEVTPQAYLIGGVVRDYLLQANFNDIDIVDLNFVDWNISYDKNNQMYELKELPPMAVEGNNFITREEFNAAIENLRN